MSRFPVAAAMAALLLSAPLSAAHAAVDRPQLIEAMKQNCFSTNSNASPAEKAKCECYAKTFVNSLTPGEIAVPKQSAAINAKLYAARHACHMGDF